LSSITLAIGDFAIAFSGDDRADAFRRDPERIVEQVRVPSRGSWLGVAEQRADHAWTQAKTRGGDSNNKGPGTAASLT
jgi:hypothetical protein